MPLTFGSLFAGIGGFDLGFERCGMQCKWQVEIDDYATKILKKHWPYIHRERDIRQCGRHNLQQVDIICGGFPCQDISYAGKGAGLDGERSGLFFEAIRLVRELRPRAVVLENVAGLLTRGLDRVLGTLAEIGFDAEWHCIPAAAVGAPHIRDRVFIIAINHRNADSDDASAKRSIPKRQDTESSGSGVLANSKRSNREQRCDVELQRRRSKKAKQAGMGCVAGDAADTESDGREQRQSHQGGSREGVETRQERGSRDGSAFFANANSPRLEGQRQVTRRTFAEFRDTGDEGWWAIEPDVGRVAHGVPNRVDRLRCLGNAIVPQVAEVVGRMVIDCLQVN